MESLWKVYHEKFFFVFWWNTFLDPVEPFLCKITSFPSWRDLAIFAILGDFSRFWALSEHFERYFPQTKLVLGCISGVFVHVWGRNMLIREFLKGFWGIARPWIWRFSAKIRFLGSFLLQGRPRYPRHFLNHGDGFFVESLPWENNFFLRMETFHKDSIFVV